MCVPTVWCVSHLKVSLFSGFLMLIPVVLMAGTLPVKEFSLNQRVRCQETVQDINWSHTIWPDANQTSKPSRRQVLSSARLREQVEEQLRMETVLAQDYGVVIDQELLQGEMNRMAANSRIPTRLRELFEALGNDPHAIAECMARPALVVRLLQNRYEQDKRYSGDPRGKPNFNSWW
ncbi:hypothetical protein [Thiolapillus sp.]